MEERRVADRYVLRRAIGQGASGAVWLAHDEVLGRSVALKRTVASAGLDQQGVRAEREAKLAAQVAHPHVVAVYDLVTDDEGTWLVMEHVDGPALSTVVREAGPLSPDDAARLLAPVADALAQAHALGIVHRDVKPSNILAAGDGGAKLTDFGIARGAEDATLTRTGLITGSPAYLAPEVATGEQANPASDVWALGATLVHLLTGRPPYHRDGADNGPLAVVYRIVHEGPPVVPEAGWLAPLLASTMARDPAQRPTMAAVRDQLELKGGLAQQTMALPPLAPPIGPPAGPPAGPPTGPPPGVAVAARSAGRPFPVRVAAAVLGAAAAIAVVTALALQGGDDGSGGSGDPEARPSASSSTTAASADRVPTAAEMEDFAEQYVRTADKDPQAGFAMLTPAYQQKSPEYAEFWGPMSKPRILEISADPDTMTVTYTYRYHFPKQGSRTETVTLQLVREDGELLIAGTGEPS